MLEILIRENGGEPKWVAAHEVLGSIAKRKPKSDSHSLPSLVSEEFKKWYLLYDKKTTKKQTIDYWLKNITKEDIPKIMEHTKHYVKDRDKVYRKDPIRYLRDRVFEDEIIKAEKKIDLDELYPFDKSGSSRLGRCSRCNSIVFGNKFSIAKDDSSCCKVKIKQYR
jgi:hypothetical protein